MEKYVVDIEIYRNLLVVVAKKLNVKEYEVFIVHESQNDTHKLITWLGQKHEIIGFNVLAFDGQILQKLWQTKGSIKLLDLYDFTQELISSSFEDRFNLPYAEWDLSHKYTDLFKINHYDNKRTSLKWLGFSTRQSKIDDLPIKPDAEVPKSKIDSVVKYCKHDVDDTESFYNRCKDMIQLREELAAKYGEDRVRNMSDSSIGSFIFEHILINKYGFKKADLKKGSSYERIAVKDCLVDYISFKDSELNKVHEIFKNRVYENVNVKGIKGEEYTITTLFQDMAFVFGSGGIHACYKAGEYVPNEDEVILSVDVSSYYPNLAIANNFFPKHIGKSFCKIYKEVYNERKLYPKGTAFNYAYKIALNSVYGKSNDKFSLFTDPAYTLKITINGQLLLTMLAEALSSLGRLLMVNTDGMEIIIPKSKVEELREICSEWEMLTGLELEYNEYKKMIIRDVNNYIAIDVKDKAKRKGMFEIYEDYTEEGGKPHQYHKSPDATIIPEALFNYYVHGNSVESTIENCNSIFDFCYGIKRQKNFEHWLITASPQGVVDIERRTERVLRYYISPQGANIYKYWTDGRDNLLTGINRGQLVQLAMNIRNPEIERVKKGTKGNPSTLQIMYDVNKQHYIDECYKWIDIINNNERDNAYIEYMKEQEKLIIN